MTLSIFFPSPASKPFIIHVTRAARQRTELRHCLTPVVPTAPVNSQENESVRGPGVLFYT